MMVVLTTLYCTSLYAQTVYYVQSVKAKVMAGANFKSPVVGEAAKGHKFVSLGKEGSWVKVKLEDKEGYVSTLLLSTHEPLEKVSVIRGEEGEIKQGVRRRASSYTSAAAARGLTSDDRKRLSREEEIDYKALDKVESFTVNPAEVSKFIEGGIL